MNLKRYNRKRLIYIIIINNSAKMWLRCVGKVRCKSYIKKKVEEYDQTEAGLHNLVVTYCGAAYFVSFARTC